MGNRYSRFWQRVNDYGNDETRDPFSHSRSYHSHFQGYAEQRVPRENGRGTRIERIYVADYYQYEESEAVWRWKKLLYGGVFLLMAGSSVLADSRQTAVNHIPVVGVVQILSFVPIIYLLYRLILQVTAPRKMTIGEREAAADGLRTAALLCGCVLLAVAVLMPTEKWIVYHSLDGADLAVAGLKLLSAISAFALCRMEKGRRLTSVPNPAEAPANANEIW